MIAVETVAGTCQIISSVKLEQSLHEGSQLSLSCGDDRAWRQITSIFHPGQPVRLFLNDLVQFTGRWESNDVPADAASGVTAELVARTRLQDARYVTADPKISIESASLKSFVLALFAPLGFAALDFQFDAAADRKLMTGELRGAPKLVDLDPITQQKAKVQPGETIMEAATRHLKRFHLMLWDGADGRIVIGKPDDEQAPSYHLQAKRGTLARSNNVLAPHRIRDWAEVVSEVRVTGHQTSADGDGDPRAILGAAGDAEVLAVANSTGHFQRTLRIPDEGALSQDRAAARARRELASRAKLKDAWDHAVDEWTYWDGSRAVPWAINTTVDVDVDTIGVDGAGRYLIYRLGRSVDVHGAATATMSLAAPGILSLG